MIARRSSGEAGEPEMGDGDERRGRSVEKESQRLLKTLHTGLRGPHNVPHEADLESLCFRLMSSLCGDCGEPVRRADGCIS